MSDNNNQSRTVIRFNLKISAAIGNLKISAAIGNLMIENDPVVKNYIYSK
jgi:hypothetical protein